MQWDAAHSCLLAPVLLVLPAAARVKEANIMSFNKEKNEGNLGICEEELKC
jgi:hypothetical protein